MSRSTLHRCRVPHAALGIAIALAAFLPVASAEAQLGGRLKKIGGDLIKDAKGESPEKKTSTSNDVVITPERLEVVIASMSTAAEGLRKSADTRSVEKEFADWQNTFNPCVENALKNPTMPTSESMEAAGKINEKQAPVLQRMGKYAQANDKRALAYVSDTARVLSLEMQLTMYSVTKCGKVRYAPAAYIEAEITRNTPSGSVGEDFGSSPRINVPAAQRGGMTHNQFGIVRERMALWALMQDGVISAEKAGKAGVFTDAERTALSARTADIKKLAPLFKNNSMSWLSWGDIQSW